MKPVCSTCDNIAEITGGGRRRPLPAPVVRLVSPASVVTCVSTAIATDVCAHRVDWPRCRDWRALLERDVAEVEYHLKWFKKEARRLEDAVSTDMSPAWNLYSRRDATASAMRLATCEEWLARAREELALLHSKDAAARLPRKRVGWQGRFYFENRPKWHCVGRPTR